MSPNVVELVRMSNLTNPQLLDPHHTNNQNWIAEEHLKHRNPRTAQKRPVCPNMAIKAKTNHTFGINNSADKALYRHLS
jgi:mRNA degradation ribonuclease J1/J2